MRVYLLLVRQMCGSQRSLVHDAFETTSRRRPTTLRVSGSVLIDVNGQFETWTKGTPRYICNRPTCGLYGAISIEDNIQFISSLCPLVEITENYFFLSFLFFLLFLFTLKKFVGLVLGAIISVPRYKTFVCIVSRCTTPVP